MGSKSKYRICTFDIETDPFMYGRTPAPFCCGFYDGEEYHEFWGDDCIAQFVDFMAEYPEPCRIFVHNGGGFDFWFLEYAITNPVFFINRRIAKCGFLDRHELRDSYKMVPIPLSAYAKEEIDYALLERTKREKNKAKILHYLMWDCKHLYSMVTDFQSRFGDHLTIGAASLKRLKEMHPGNKNTSELWDEIYRPYYMGGRCEVFERGHITGDLHIFDVNSMYPGVMKSYQHPMNSSYFMRPTNKLPDSHGIYFARFIGESDGALPIMARNKSGQPQGLSFPKGVFEFSACCHEILMALKLGKLKIIKILEIREFHESQNFANYVDWAMDGKITAEKEGDKAGRHFYKLFANNAYGKFGSNPRAYTDCEIFENVQAIQERNAALAKEFEEKAKFDRVVAGRPVPAFKIVGEFGEKLLAAKPAELQASSFKNVAIAASITSAARAEMMLGISKAVRPIYCDTDSIVCEDFKGDIDPHRVGAWDHEKSFDEIYIAGKKMYSAFKDGECVKKASKGAQLSGDEIRRIAMGEDITKQIDAPSLRASQEARFMTRSFTRT